MASPAASLSADLYKRTSQSGRVSFSDKPLPGYTRVEDKKIDVFANDHREEISNTLGGYQNSSPPKKKTIRYKAKPNNKLDALSLAELEKLCEEKASKNIAVAKQRRIDSCVSNERRHEKNSAWKSDPKGYCQRKYWDYGAPVITQRRTGSFPGKYVVKGGFRNTVACRAADKARQNAKKKIN